MLCMKNRSIIIIVFLMVFFNEVNAEYYRCPDHSVSVKNNRCKEICSNTCGGKSDNRYYRLKMSTTSNSIIQIHINDAEDPIEMITEVDEYWSPHIDSNCARVCHNSDDDNSLSIDGIYIEGAISSTRSFFPATKPTFEDPTSLGSDDINNYSEKIVQIYYMEKDIEKTCNGIFITNDVILTSEHCGKSRNIARTFVIKSVYDHIENNFTYDSISGYYPYKEYDVMLISFIDTLPFNNDYPIIRSDGPRDKEELFILQYPDQEELVINMDEKCIVVELDVDGRSKNSDFSHRCDTTTGSSGAPVFSRKNGCIGIVGVHHWGAGTIDPEGYNRAVSIDKFLSNAEKSKLHREFYNRVNSRVNKKDCS